MKKRKNKLIFCIFFLILSSQLVFCQNGFSFSSAKDIVGKTFVFPKEENIKFINNIETNQNGKGKIIILIHYTGCKCELTDLEKWDSIINTKEIWKKIPVYIIICNVCDYEDDVILNTIHSLNYKHDKYNLIIDTKLEFLKNNTISLNTILNTYVIDNRNVIKYVGNPTIRKKELTDFLLATDNLY